MLLELVAMGALAAVFAWGFVNGLTWLLLAPKDDDDDR